MVLVCNSIGVLVLVGDVIALGFGFSLVGLLHLLVNFTMDCWFLVDMYGWFGLMFCWGVLVTLVSITGFMGEVLFCPVFTEVMLLAPVFMTTLELSPIWMDSSEVFGFL